MQCCVKSLSSHTYFFFLIFSLNNCAQPVSASPLNAQPAKRALREFDTKPRRSGGAFVPCENPTSVFLVRCLLHRGTLLPSVHSTSCILYPEPKCSQCVLTNFPRTRSLTLSPRTTKGNGLHSRNALNGCRRLRTLGISTNIVETSREYFS